MAFVVSTTRALIYKKFYFCCHANKLARLHPAVRVSHRGIVPLSWGWTGLYWCWKVRLDWAWQV